MYPRVSMRDVPASWCMIKAIGRTAMRIDTIVWARATSFPIRSNFLSELMSARNEYVCATICMDIHDTAFH
jgi:hypothetical protein